MGLSYWLVYFFEEVLHDILRSPEQYKSVNLSYFRHQSGMTLEWYPINIKSNTMQESRQPDAGFIIY